VDISQVSKRSGVPASALRYYEEKGLISSSGRYGLKRLFDPSVLDQLALISLGQVAGFTLDEIALMLTPAGQLSIDRQMLTKKANEIDAMIVRLKAMSKGLKHAAACPAPTHLECPSFRRLMRAASSGALVPAGRKPIKKKK
jgi:DNA-binding transcriptional MerR regulator